ncbi:MAG: hypothetical protein IH595_13725 [Bacteroidales bacterium]|nr:hypothetical protein [Bacteroidales bacterium]
MSSFLTEPESKFLERTRVALTNAGSHAEIKPLLASFGMDETKLNEGWSLYEKAKTSWENKQKEDAETQVASNAYHKAYEELESLFKRHRDQAQIFFKKQPDFLILLGVRGPFPSSYNKFFDKTKEFYMAIQSMPEIQEKLTLCQITPEVVADCLAKHQALLSLRADYEKEVGESQASTQSKNAALIELKEWKDNSDSLAKIALYDKPQLLEVLGIFVRS